jgi:signal transduction histidine kinase
VAHEFNNLMTVVVGRAQWLLTQYGDDATLRAQLEVVERAGQRAAHLTAQLVAFCYGAGFAPRRLDLNDVLRGALPALGARSAGVELVTRLRDGLPRPRGGPHPARARAPAAGDERPRCHAGGRADHRRDRGYLRPRAAPLGRARLPIPVTA